MADPTQKVRTGVMQRDGERCVCCGTHWGLTFQHRRAVGMGGTKVKPGYADGLAACASCNTAFESNLQTIALLNGWKVLKWVTDPSAIPYYHASTEKWYVLDSNGPWRTEVTLIEAVRMKCEVYGPTADGGGTGG